MRWLTARVCTKGAQARRLCGVEEVSQKGRTIPGSNGPFPQASGKSMDFYFFVDHRSIFTTYGAWKGAELQPALKSR
eukprot:scaffold3624_cov321-Pinguiococcus_pyrenoidosus.AAC.4